MSKIIHDTIIKTDTIIQTMSDTVYIKENSDLLKTYEQMMANQNNTYAIGMGVILTVFAILLALQYFASVHKMKSTVSDEIKSQIAEHKKVLDKKIFGIKGFQAYLVGNNNWGYIQHKTLKKETLGRFFSLSISQFVIGMKYYSKSDNEAQMSNIANDLPKILQDLISKGCETEFVKYYTMNLSLVDLAIDIWHLEKSFPKEYKETYDQLTKVLTNGGSKNISELREIGKTNKELRKAIIKN